MRIVVATDGSESASRAVDFAAKLTKSFPGPLIIVHVVNVENMPSSELAAYSISEHATLADVLNVFAEERLSEARRRAQLAGAIDIRTETPFGDVAESILERAEFHKAEIIVVGRRGRSRLAGLIMGSVSQKMVSIASCPVVVVP